MSDFIILKLRGEIQKLKHFNEGLNLACDTLRNELASVKELKLELINSLADEKALNKNLTQTNQLLEILRHNQEAKLVKIEELANSPTMFRSQLGLDLKCVESVKLKKVLGCNNIE